MKFTGTMAFIQAPWSLNKSQRAITGGGAVVDSMVSSEWCNGCCCVECPKGIPKRKLNISMFVQIPVMVSQHFSPLSSLLSPDTGDGGNMVTST